RAGDRSSGAAGCAPTRVPILLERQPSCTHRPTRYSGPIVAPPPVKNCRLIQGFPPTPPKTGCFGNWMVVPGGRISSLTLVVTSASCGPPTGLSLLRKISSALTPALSVKVPLNVMYGPGLLVQSPANTTASALEGSVKSVASDVRPCTQRPR